MNPLMNSTLRQQALSLDDGERCDLMMALFESLSDAELPILSEVRILDLEKLVLSYQSYPEPTVAYGEVVRRLRLRRDSFPG